MENVFISGDAKCLALPILACIPGKGCERFVSIITNLAYGKISVKNKLQKKSGRLP